MTKSRKPRSDSTTEAVAAFARRRENIPDHITLRECDLPYWKAGLSARDDWQPHELDLLAHWAHAMADHYRLSREIDVEGTVIVGKPNLKFALAETLIRRALSLARHLQIHGRAQRGESRDAAKRMPLPDFEGDDDGLIPGLH